MTVNYIIVGQGLCGTWLSYFLKKEGKRVVVIDDGDPKASSRSAAGLINPVTGRRIVKVWMAEEILSFADKHYHEIGDLLQLQAIQTKSIIDFFATPQMRLAFTDRIEENSDYLHSYPEQNQFNQNFNYDFGCGEIRPAYVAYPAPLMKAWSTVLQDQGILLQEKFDVNELQFLSDGISYKNILAEKIIFCDGYYAANNSWFSLLPFAPNKGEALFVEIKDIEPAHIYKKGMMLVPLPEENLFWIGSNYAWEFEDDKPTQLFYQQTESLLSTWLKVPFKILDHRAAVRPATLERRPFVGLHPRQTSVGILNGMGTKGTSLAPYFAKQLSDHLCHKHPLLPEADVKRFQRILSQV